MATAKEKAEQAEREAAEKAAIEQEQAEQAAAEQAAMEQAAQEAAAKAAAEQAGAGEASEAANGAATGAAPQTPEAAPAGVMKVFCKLPSGMTFSLPGGDVTLKGANDSALLGGYGVTFMSERKWTDLFVRYGDMDAFRKNIIFAEQNINDGVAIAKEMNGERTGFEGVDPKNPGKDLQPATK